MLGARGPRIGIQTHMTLLYDWGQVTSFSGRQHPRQAVQAVALLTHPSSSPFLYSLRHTAETLCLLHCWCLVPPSQQCLSPAMPLPRLYLSSFFKPLLGYHCGQLSWCIIRKSDFYFFNVYLFLRERQRVSRRETEKEGDTESKAGSRLPADSTEPDAWLELTDGEVMT